jgi:hypothetical protein
MFFVLANFGGVAVGVGEVNSQSQQVHGPIRYSARRLELGGSGFLLQDLCGRS